jgi:putative DNA primase/helicase
VNLSDRIGDLAELILGAPNKKQSTRSQLRFGTNGSVAVDTAGPNAGTWFDHEIGKGGGWRELLRIKGRIADEDIDGWLERAGFDAKSNGHDPSGKMKVVATYDYCDEKGDLLFQVCRLHPKTFRQRRPNGGGWEWSTKGTRMVPYRLPELVAAAARGNGMPWRVYIVEGEKDVDRLRNQWGLTATCNPAGAGKWREDYNRYFGRADVVVIADNDGAGRKHAQEVARALMPVAACVRIVELNWLPEKGDISDWMDDGASQSDLETFVKIVEPFTPEKASEQPIKPGTFVIDPAAPYQIAKLFRAKLFYSADAPILFHHRGAFYYWSSGAYSELHDADLRSRLYAFLDQCLTEDGKGRREPFRPNKSRVANVIDGLEAAANLPTAISAPIWLASGIDFDPAEIIACRNGLLHLPSSALLSHTPLFFTYNALNFSYVRSAPSPVEWLKFLGELWRDDAESVETLQEIFGLCLTTETRHQKAFLLIGPKRSGKGTIARVLTALVGRCNTVSPTLASLGERFGLEPLIGKLLAIISDARLGVKADQHAVAESVLRITGEDDITADRKNRQAWTGRMRVRFLVISNELPRLADASGAIASRFIILRLVNSFYGREDQMLTDKLLTELPGLLNWAIAGLDRLKARGHFIQPASAAETVRELEDLSSPIGAFIRDRCRVGPERSVEINRMFEAWCEWCKTQGRDHPGTIQSFGRELRAALPTLKTSQPRSGDDRMRFYQGIGLEPVWMERDGTGASAL